jgi:cellulose synthase operon protein C
VGHASYFLDDFAEAEKELGQFVSAAPHDALTEWALPYLADSELRLKKPEVALKHFQQALDAFPRGEMVEDARFGLARSFELLKKPAEAIHAYEEIAANRAGAHAAEAQLNLGSLQFDSGDYAAAAAAFEAFEQRFPESSQAPQAQLNLGFSLYQLHEYQKAIAPFEKAARVDRYAAEAALWKGLSLKAMADYAQAVAVLKAAYEKHRDQPIAEKLLYQWALCEDRRGSRDEARRLFLEVADRWPKGSLADESLHATCAASVDLLKLPEAEALISRFEREFPGNRLRYRQEILKGRILAARSDYAGAARIYQSVISTSGIESTTLQARYYLGYALQNLAQHAQAIEVTEPLAKQIPSDKTLADYAGVFVMRASSQLALARMAGAKGKPREASAERKSLCAAAVESSRRYRERAPKGPLVAQSLELAAIAETLNLNPAAAQADLEILRKNHPRSSELEKALFELGTIAFSWDDFERAERLFSELAAWPKESRLHSQALADLGWSLHRQKKNVEAAASFARLLAEHPGDELVPEAAFMHGRTLQDAGKLTEAQAAFADAAKRPGNANETYMAGLQSARLLGRMKKSAEADAAYDELFKRFPKRPDGDKVLDEWAGLHYSAENYARADEILRRLTAEYPSSDLADNARLSLAESAFLSGQLDEARRQFAALSISQAADEVVQQKALYQLMRIELEARHWEGLRKLCGDSLSRFPDGTYRYEFELHLAEADLNLGDFKAAQDRLVRLKSLKDKPGFKPGDWFPSVWVMLAETQWRLKAYDAVADTVAEFRAWDPQSPVLYQADEILGRSFKTQAKWVEARAAFERVLKDPHGKLSETAAKSQFLLADTYFWEKNYQTALKEYLKVDILYKFPELQAAALYQAGVCHEELNNWKEAAKTYDDILRRFPNDRNAETARKQVIAVRKRLSSG